MLKNIDDILSSSESDFLLAYQAPSVKNDGENGHNLNTGDKIQKDSAECDSGLESSSTHSLKNTTQNCDISQNDLLKDAIDETLNLIEKEMICGLENGSLETTQPQIGENMLAVCAVEDITSYKNSYKLDPTNGEKFLTCDFKKQSLKKSLNVKSKPKTEITRGFLTSSSSTTKNRKQISGSFPVVSFLDNIEPVKIVNELANTIAYRIDSSACESLCSLQQLFPNLMITDCERKFLLEHSPLLYVHNTTNWRQDKLCYYLGLGFIHTELTDFVQHVVTLKTTGKSSQQQQQKKISTANISSGELEILSYLYWDLSTQDLLAIDESSNGDLKKVFLNLCLDFWEKIVQKNRNSPQKVSSVWEALITYGVFYNQDCLHTLTLQVVKNSFNDILEVCEEFDSSNELASNWSSFMEIVGIHHYRCAHTLNELHHKYKDFSKYLPNENLLYDFNSFSAIPNTDIRRSLGGNCLKLTSAQSRSIKESLLCFLDRLACLFAFYACIENGLYSNGKLTETNIHHICIKIMEALGFIDDENYSQIPVFFEAIPKSFGSTFIRYLGFYFHSYFIVCKRYGITKLTSCNTTIPNKLGNYFALFMKTVLNCAFIDLQDSTEQLQLGNLIEHIANLTRQLDEIKKKVDTKRLSLLINRNYLQMFTVENFDYEFIEKANSMCLRSNKRKRKSSVTKTVGVNDDREDILRTEKTHFELLRDDSNRKKCKLCSENSTTNVYRFGKNEWSVCSWCINLLGKLYRTNPQKYGTPEKLVAIIEKRLSTFVKPCVLDHEKEDFIGASQLRKKRKSNTKK